MFPRLWNRRGSVIICATISLLFTVSLESDYLSSSLSDALGDGFASVAGVARTGV
jgi:hypothetical protein